MFPPSGDENVGLFYVFRAGHTRWETISWQLEQIISSAVDRLRSGKTSVLWLIS